MWMRVVVAIILLLLPASAFAQMDKHIALLIGNRAYDGSVGVLKNPHNDIALVGEALARQGFEVLPPIKDARRSAILGGVRELVRRLNTAGAGAIGFLYYSGHGAAEKDTNINYLIPIDAKEPGTTTFWDESLKLDDVLRLLDGARTAAKFIVFDACRNELQLPTKDTSKGLIPVTEQQGMFIAYASAPGRTASDRGEKSGPYAAALASELGHTGLDHLNLFQNVKEAVMASTGGTQQPWESNGLGRRVYLTGQQKPTDASAQPRLSEAAEAWDRAKDSTSIGVLDAFILRFKDTFYADLAGARINELKKGVSRAPPNPSDTERLERIRTQIATATSTNFLDATLRSEPSLKPEIEARRRQLAIPAPKPAEPALTVAPSPLPNPQVRPPTPEEYARLERIKTQIAIATSTEFLEATLRSEPSLKTEIEARKRQLATRGLGEANKKASSASTERLERIRTQIAIATSTEFLEAMLRSEPSLLPEIEARRRQLANDVARQRSRP